MKCQYLNKDNPLEMNCGATATWLLVQGRQGYPSNEPVLTNPTPYCGLHAVAVCTWSIAQAERHIASVQAIRIENATDMQDIARRRGREIGS